MIYTALFLMVEALCRDAGGEKGCIHCGRGDPDSIFVIQKCRSFSTTGTVFFSVFFISNDNIIAMVINSSNLPVCIWDRSPHCSLSLGMGKVLPD